MKNAIIKRTQLLTEDHGIFTCFIDLDYGDSGQVFGGYAFDKYDKEKHKRVGGDYGMKFIMEVLRVLEVRSWEELPGTHCRVVQTHDGVQKIGHYIKDQWFDPKDLQ